MSGEEPEIMELFTVEEWTEMKADFNKTVVLKEMDTKEEDLIYDLIDKIEKVNALFFGFVLREILLMFNIIQVLKRKSDDIVTDIEECIIKVHDNLNINLLKLCILIFETYAF